MEGRVDVKSFESVEHFRSALIRFLETANATMASAEVEIIRTISWLETEQLPHWKKMLRTTADEIEQAKRAYREKTLFKDSTGARHSGIDELKALRKAEAKRAEVERRALATRRNLRQLEREYSLYQAAIQQLRSMVNGRLPVAVEELRRIVEQLERYANAAPDHVPRPERASGAGREPPTSPGGALDIEPAERDRDSIDDIRRRTPGPHLRQRAERSTCVPDLPQVPSLALETLLTHVSEEKPGRYALVTTTLDADDAGGDMYFERRAPVSENDTGWHIGPAGSETRGGPCVTITVGRIESKWPDAARLLSLPTGCFLKAVGGQLVLVVDAMGRTLWRAEEAESKGEG